MPNYEEIARYFCDLFERYSENPPIDRILPEYRVTWSDLTAKFTGLSVDDRIAVQPYIDREMKRRKLSFRRG